MRRSRQLTRLARAARALLLVFSAFAFAAVALSARPAFAGEKDEDALIGVAEGLGQHLSGKSDAALTALQKLLATCTGAACEKSTRAQIYLAIGIVQASGKKDLEAARVSFEYALYEDSTVSPDRQFTTANVTSAFNAAKAEFKKNGGKPPPSRPPPSKDQLEAVSTAQGQLGSRDWSGCMQTAIAAMVDREFAAGKLILARCEDAGGLVIEATADARLALKFADEERNTEVQSKAQALVTKLEADTPTLVLILPRAVSGLEIKVDGVVVTKEAAEKGIPRNPGKATIEIKGKKGQFPFKFKTTENIDRGERITVNADQGDNKNNAAVQQCLLAARTPDDLKNCIESGGKQRGLTVLGGLEFTTYNATDVVNVVSPAVYFSAENPTSGWQIGGSALVDVVSSASPDIVATASRRYDEVRVAGSLAGSYKVGPAKIGINGAFSHEGDYAGRGGGVSVSADLFEKRVTPALSYSFGYDTMGRTGTPWDVFSRDVMRHTIDAGASIVLTGTTIVVAGGTVQLDVGDYSKPYRHVAMFAPDTASLLPRGATRSLVAGNRLDLMPFEQVPEDGRNRFAVFGRVAHRFDTATLRADERLYVDDWGMLATTTDLRYLYDVNDPLRIGPHVRFHLQNGVDFWQRAYAANLTPDGWQIPKYRTGDKENGPMFALTLGMYARYQLSETFAASVQVEGIYSQYLDHLYIFDRLGVFTSTSIDMEID
ncbi:MAG: DUF3570 domain-containing protein [Polyangiaceae bacterium]